MTTLGFILVGLGILLILSVLFNSWGNAWDLLSGGKGMGGTFQPPPANGAN